MNRLLLIFLTAVSAMGSLIDANRVTSWAASDVGVQGGIQTTRTQWCNIKVSIPGTGLVAVGDGIANDTDAFAFAEANCPRTGEIYAPTSSYAVDQPLGNSGAVIRGDGMGRTIILGYSGSGAYRQYLSSQSNERMISLYAPSTVVVTNGQTQVSVVSTPTGLQVGMWMVINEDQDGTLVESQGLDGSDVTDWAGAAAVPVTTPSTTEHIYAGHMVKVTAINSVTNITFDPPWKSITLTNTLTPRIYYWSLGGPQNCYESWGLEDMTLVNMAGSGQPYLAEIHRDANGYFKRVEFRNFQNAGLFAFLSARITVENCLFNGTIDNAQGGGYGIENQVGGVGWLVQNNIFMGCRVPFIVEGGAGGVYAYNYSTVTNNSSALQKDPSIHACYPAFNLFEGNIAHRMGPDNTHGSSGFNTFFRNWAQATNTWMTSPASTSYRIAISNERFSKYNNYVGNILGYPGVTYTSYTNNATDGRDAANLYIVNIGYQNDGDGGSDPKDTTTFPTIQLHANYDFKNLSVMMDGTHTSSYIPESLYLSSKPTWWKGPWPAFGPTTNGVAVISTNLTQLVNPAFLTWSNYLAAGTLDWSGDPAPGTSPYRPSRIMRRR